VKRLTKLFRWLNLLLILVTFLAYVSPHINPVSFSWLNIISTAYPWLLLLNFTFLIGWLFVKNRYFLFSLACIILGWNHLTSFIGLHPGGFSSSDNAIRVVTFNTSGLGFLADKDTVQHKQNVRDFIRNINAKGPIDIFCLQEVSSIDAREAIKKFGYKYEHRIKYHGASILSQHPIISSGEVDFTTSTNSCVWADIKVKGQTVRVYSVHLKSNQVSTETEKILKKGGMQEKEAWSDIKGIFGKFRYMSKIRVEQAQRVRRHMEGSPHPIILAGDFNETPQSYIYALLSEGLQDSFREAGFGIGSTYAGRIPALRIDYTLVDPRLKILDCVILRKDYSDHYPVLTSLSW
jgi:endonuclease/exonuclease/phosphatase family metal-dependent hydrolase